MKVVVPTITTTMGVTMGFGLLSCFAIVVIFGRATIVATYSIPSPAEFGIIPSNHPCIVGSRACLGQLRVG